MLIMGRCKQKGIQWKVSEFFLIEKEREYNLIVAEQ